MSTRDWSSDVCSSDLKQAKNGCGPASVSMVMAYWRPGGSDPAGIERALYSRDTGTFAADIERFFSQEGFSAFAFQGEWADLAQRSEERRVGRERGGTG